MGETQKPGKVFNPSWRKQAEEDGRLVRMSAPKRMTAAEARSAGVEGLEDLPDKLPVYVHQKAPPSPQK